MYQRTWCIIKPPCGYFPFFFFAVSHILPDSSLIFLPVHPLNTSLVFFSSSPWAHRLIHNLQGQFMHMFQPGALSRNVSQHAEKRCRANEPTTNRLFWRTAGNVILKPLCINEPSVLPPPSQPLLCFHGVQERDGWRELHSQMQRVCVVIFRWETSSSTI